MNTIEVDRAVTEAEIRRLKSTIATPQQALAIEAVAADAYVQWEREYPGQGLGVKDSAIVAGRALHDEGYATSAEEGRLLVFAARSWLYEARRLFA